MKKLKVFVFISFVAAFLISCGGYGSFGSLENSLVGRWEAVSDGVEVDYGDLDELEFFSDGTYSSNLTNYSGGYSVEEDSISLSGIIASSYTFSFEVSGDTLTMYDDDGNEYQYEKIEDSGGSDYSKEDLVGKWEAEGYGIDGGIHLKELEFFDGGSYASNSDNYSGGYSVDGNRLKLTGTLVEALTFTFELDGDTLIIYEENGNTEQYNRVDK